MRSIHSMLSAATPSMHSVGVTSGCETSAQVTVWALTRSVVRKRPEPQQDEQQNV